MSVEILINLLNYRKEYVEKSRLNLKLTDKFALNYITYETTRFRKKKLQKFEKKLLTQEELVAKCEINIRTLQRIEAGEVTPRAYTLKAILKAMDYSVPEFLELNINKKSSVSVISSWLSSWYSEITNLFNFKFNTMKRNLIFLLSLFLVVF